jgi:hypothetical protein
MCGVMMGVGATSTKQAEANMKLMPLSKQQQNIRRQMSTGLAATIATSSFPFTSTGAGQRVKRSFARSAPQQDGRMLPLVKLGLKK